MSTKDFEGAGPARRTLLKLVGVGAAGVLPPASASASGSAQPAPAPAAAMAMPAARAETGKPAAAGYVFLNEDESAFVEAAVNCFIPADDYGPAGVDLGVASFIDRQLDGGYGRGERMYLQGPFLEGTPEQGYQLQLTPAELVRTGLADVAAHIQDTRKTTFDALPAADQVAILTDLQHGRIELARVPTGDFFGILFQLAMDGFFSDPIYGGNRDKASWRMLGYPGVGEMYADKIGPYRNKAYRVEPKSIQDLT